MDYDLALRLKETGFPQEGSGKDLWDKYKTDLEFVYEPTLEELIEECYGPHFILTNGYYSNQWEASVSVELFNGWETVKTSGATTKEAVANLYLKLNENEKEN